MKDDYINFYQNTIPEIGKEEHKRKQAEDHGRYEELKDFIERFQLKDKKCLEIGSLSGIFQDLVVDYYGTDISDNYAKYYHKPYKVVNVDMRYPFDDSMFDAIWTITVFEHIPGLQDALLEIKRLLKPGGVIFFCPAWYCPSWLAEGYSVRPYRDFNWKGKLIKASIPLRKSIIWRSIFVFPKRFIRHLLFLFGFKYMNIHYKKLKANYETYWVSDADACNSIDPHDALLWFLSHGFVCLSHPSHLSMFFVRNGPLILKKLTSKL
jgi:SAM-dependent methyltransferase